MTDEYLHTFSAMGTVVTIHVVGHGATEAQREARKDLVRRAADWFDEIERCCSRFSPTSELSLLSTRVGEAVPVSDMLFEAVHFALAVAAESDGAFDPAVGHRMEERGFDLDRRTGKKIRSNISVGETVSFRNVHVDTRNRTITLDRPLRLDLGAVAKGLAIDTAARELAEFENFAVDAGGDLYLAGLNAQNAPWSVGVRHPRTAGEIIDTFHVSDTAVCTSGDYERVNRQDAHHIMDPRTGQSAVKSSSVTVIAPSAMVADALATAAFVLGPVRGIAFLQRQQVEGLIVTPTLECFTTRGVHPYRSESAAP